MLGAGIDAVSGATITSTVVVRAVNEILKNAAPAPAEEKKEETPAAEGGALTATKAGFNDGDVIVTLTLDENGAITSITVNADTQTPGIGTRCAEEAFTKQFIGKSGKVMLGAGIDAVSGATVTSTAVVRAVNEILKNAAAAPAEEKKEEAADKQAEPEEKPAAPVIEMPEGSVTASGIGFSGKPVTVGLTLDEAGAITAMAVDAGAETAELGQKCMDKAFTDQFIGKSGELVLGRDIDAVSGATITSTVVVRTVNEILKNVAAAPAEEKKEEAPAETEEAPAETEEAPAETAQAAESTELKATRPGYDGQPVTVTLTLDENGVITAITVDAATQTAGIGQRCAEEAFTNQFIGVSGLVMIGVNIDAVSGATVTSQAVVRAVDEIVSGQK